MMQPYTNTGPVDCEVEYDTNNVKGRTAIVTGGASGMGEQYVRSLSKAGAYVVVADINEANGKRLAEELGNHVCFVKCNVILWADNLAAFRAALELSPEGRVDVVVVNAGIGGTDPVFVTDFEAEEPEEPSLFIKDVNLTGPLYATKLALHYFRRQNATSEGRPRDQVLILQGSMAAYLDLPGPSQYVAAKWGLRGLMRSLRLTEWQHNIRVVSTMPWFVKTEIFTKQARDALEAGGMPFATVQDAARTVMRIVSDPTINGRALAIMPRSLAPGGYLDLSVDDHEAGGIFEQYQKIVAGGDDSILSDSK